MIEAGDLRPDAALRKTCERAKTAVAIGCYLDDARALGQLIDEELRLANLRIASDARAILTSLLGGDRQSSRNELRKLTLYAHGQGEITLDDVIACVSDASDLKLDPVVDFALPANRRRLRSSSPSAQCRHLSGADPVGGAAPGDLAAQGGAGR